MIPLQTRRRAFTLIEVMVTIGVIALLLAITLPALRNARITADSAGCQVNLASIAKLHAACQAACNGEFPNAFDHGTVWIEWRFNGIGFGLQSTITQADWWPGPLWAKGFYESDEPTAGVSCPSVRRTWLTRRLSDTDGDDSPILSFRYSPAMFTEAKLWEPADLAATVARADFLGPDRYRKSVRIEEVKFPSAKVVMSEREDNHGRGAIFGDPALTPEDRAAARANVSFADGHVDRVAPYQAFEPLPINWGYEWLPGEIGAIPFSAAPHGHRGRDF